MLNDATPVPLAALSADVTIYEIESNALGGNVTTPALVADDLPRILKIYNSGSQSLFVNPAVGTFFNALAPAIEIPPGCGTEFQPRSTSVWYVTLGAIIAP